MTPEQRYLFDLHGFIVIAGALCVDEVKRCREALYRLAREQQPGDFDDRGEPTKRMHVNRQVYKDDAFLDLIDHPSVIDIVTELVGTPIMVDNTSALVPRSQEPQTWHGGGHPGVPVYQYRDGKFFCSMVKCIWYLSDCEVGQGGTRIVPGSHKSLVAPPVLGSGEVPGGVELGMCAGSLLIFAEACMHAGNTNPSDATRLALFYNYGPGIASAGTCHARTQVPTRNRDLFE